MVLSVASLPQPWLLTLTRSVHAFGSASTPTTSTLAHTTQAIGRPLTSFSSRQSADIAQDAGFRTNRGSRVPTSRGQRRGDLEIKGLNVAGTPDLIVDVALVHD